MILLNLDSFKGGKYNIPDSLGFYSKSNVQEMINRYEKQYIYQLLGVVLGDKIIAYLATTPAPRTPANIHYNKILDPFSMDDDTSMCVIQSLGITEYLKAGIFYEYVKNGLKNSQAAVVKTESETSKAATPAITLRFAENKFNDVLDTIEAIQWYCLENETEFPDFNGQRITIKTQFFL